MDQTELDALKADLRRMQARVDELERAEETPTNRRNMLKGLGAAAAGAAVGGLAFARPAAATDGGNVVIGNSAQTATSPTWIVPTTGWSSSPFSGAFTVSNEPGFTNINASLSCIAAYADSTQASGHNIGVFAASKAGVGAKLDGPVPLKLTDSTNSAAPSQSAGSIGQFKVTNGDLWFCVNDSTAANSHNWRKIAGVGVAGGYHALTPARVLDTHFAGGSMTSGTNRTVSVANSINVSSGALATANFVPAAASAIHANVTLVTNAGRGYVAANPGGVTAVTASTVNFTTGGQVVGNGITLTLNALRQLTLVCNGTGADTHVIIDVFGYYI